MIFLTILLEIIGTMLKAAIKAIQAEVGKGFEAMWDEEVDCFAVGMGEPESIEDVPREEVVVTIMKRIEDAGTGAAEAKSVDDLSSRVEKMTVEVKRIPGPEVKRVARPYEIFCNAVLEEWRRANPGRDHPKDGAMSLISPLWHMSFMNSASEEYDKARTQELVSMYN